MITLGLVVAAVAVTAAAVVAGRLARAATAAVTRTGAPCGPWICPYPDPEESPPRARWTCPGCGTHYRLTRGQPHAEHGYWVFDRRWLWQQ